MLKELLAILQAGTSAISSYNNFDCPLIRLFSMEISNRTCFKIVCLQNNFFWQNQFFFFKFLEPQPMIKAGSLFEQECISNMYLNLFVLNSKTFESKSNNIIISIKQMQTLPFLNQYSLKFVENLKDIYQIQKYCIYCILLYFTIFNLF